MKVDGIDVDRKRNEMQQKSLAGVKLGTLRICGMHSNQLATEALPNRVDFDRRVKTRIDCVFQSAASKLWNSLPISLRFLDTVDSFKKHLKTPSVQTGV